MKIDINHLEKLANLNLKKPEKEKMEKQLEDTLSFIEKLNQLETSEVKATNQVTSLENVTREDVIKPSLPEDDVLRNAGKTKNGMFLTEAILTKKNYE